jgi:hypothetical protein
MTNAPLQAIRVMQRKGSTFVGIRQYTAKGTGEEANHTILAGYSYDNAKQHDLAIVQSADAEALATQVNQPVELVQQALAEIEKSLTKPDKARSEAQANAYTHVGNGLKIHNDNGDLYVHGLTVSKKILKAGEYPTVNSKPITICKNKVKKALGLRTDKIRTYIFNNGTFAMRGVKV